MFTEIGACPNCGNPTYLDVVEIDTNFAINKFLDHFGVTIYCYKCDVEMVAELHTSDFQEARDE